MSSPSRFVIASSSMPLIIVGITRRHRVKPAAAPRAAGGRAEFAAHLVQHFGELCDLRSAARPSPTRVVYAFITPTTRSIRCGGTPVPVQAPPAVVFDEVTYG